MKNGVDVSYANGKIDWEKAKKDIGFAIIRSSFGSDLPGQTDNCYRQNAEGCIRSGIPFGTYHFAYFTDTKSAKNEADFAVRLADEYKTHVRFIALDIEEDSVRYASQCGASPDWTECAAVFLERVKEAGYRPVIYANQSWIVSMYDWDKLKNYPLWYAAPGAEKPAYRCDVWQYSWSGNISGINGNVDLDRCFEDKLFDDKKIGDDEIGQINSSEKVKYTVKVTSSDGINIRSGAGTSYKILGAVPCGARVQISRRTNGGGYIWGLTEYSGIKGWIALNYTEKIHDKSIEELALEVIRGEWGAGDERKKLLTQAGYDYNAVQSRVNQIMSRQ